MRINKDHVRKAYKSYVARWTAIACIVGSIITMVGWIGGIHDWVDGKVNRYIEIQREIIIMSTDSVISAKIDAEKAYYDSLIVQRDSTRAFIIHIITEYGATLSITNDALLGELDRVENTGDLFIWRSNSGKFYYEDNGRLYTAWKEGNRGVWMYREYDGKNYKCE